MSQFSLTCSISYLYLCFCQVYIETVAWDIGEISVITIYLFFLVEFCDAVTWDIGEVSVVTNFINMFNFLSVYVLLWSVYWDCYVRNRRSFSHHYILGHFVEFCDTVTWDIGEVSVVAILIIMFNFLSVPVCL